MLQLLPLAIVAIVLAADAIPVDDLPLLTSSIPLRVVASLAPNLVLCAVVAIGVRLAMRRLNRTGSTMLVYHVDRLLPLALWAAVALHAAAVLLFGWLELTRRAVGNLVLLDELLTTLVPLATLGGVWWAFYPIERRVREALVIRRLDSGLSVHDPPSRWTFVTQQVRAHVLMLLVPLWLITAGREIMELIARRIDSDAAQIALVELGTPLAVLCVLAIAPLLMRVVLDLSPLPDGPTRRDLLAVCKAHGVRVRQLLLWRTGGTMLNAAVAGFIRPLRVVMITDCLLEHMSRQELIAVMAHEIGHVRKHHMLWMLLSLVAMMSIASLFIWGILVLLPESVAVEGRSGFWVQTTLTVAAIGVVLVVFGWVSRRFERQADTFAVQHLSAHEIVEPEDAPASNAQSVDAHASDADIAPPDVNALDPASNDADRSPPDERDPHAITPRAVHTMTSALGRVVDAHMANPSKHSWRHGSIAWRCAYLANLVGLDGRTLAIDRIIGRIKFASCVVIAIMALWQGWLLGTSWLAEQSPADSLTTNAAADRGRIESMERP